jgi:mono/diheme cytochrome c family protein
LTPSNRRSRRIAHHLYAALALSLTTSLGCWEQWSESWFPQMKWQKAVQAFERTKHPTENSVAAFLPPEGSVPTDGGEAPVSNLIDAESDSVMNPRPATLDSIQNGKAQFARFCQPCHGASGAGDGTVSVTGPLQGPLMGVLPLSGPGSIANVRSEGHLYTTIRYGRRRMPGYARIQATDRWDIVNYIRYMNGKTGVTQ